MILQDFSFYKIQTCLGNYSCFHYSYLHVYELNLLCLCSQLKGTFPKLLGSWSSERAPWKEYGFTNIQTHWLVFSNLFQKPWIFFSFLWGQIAGRRDCTVIFKKFTSTTSLGWQRCHCAYSITTYSVETPYLKLSCGFSHCPFMANFRRHH